MSQSVYNSVLSTQSGSILANALQLVQAIKVLGDIGRQYHPGNKLFDLSRLIRAVTLQKVHLAVFPEYLPEGRQVHLFED